jgi:hypothetical protein
MHKERDVGKVAKIGIAVLADYLAGVDKQRANTADPQLISEVDSFFAECTGR